MELKRGVVIGAARNSRKTDGCFGQDGQEGLHAQGFEEQWNGAKADSNIRCATDLCNDSVLFVPRKRQQDGQQVDE